MPTFAEKPSFPGEYRSDLGIGCGLTAAPLGESEGSVHPKGGLHKMYPQGQGPVEKASLRAEKRTPRSFLDQGQRKQTGRDFFILSGQVPTRGRGSGCGAP